jgi:hypothetical protein
VQLAWLDETLRAFEADGSIRGVLLLAHHPPFTNSTVTGDERDVREHFVPRVHRFRKVQGYVSGHVHSYERFMREGKLFLVSGGGGGPRAELATGAARRHPDDLHEGPPLRGFHFLLFHPEPEGLEVEVRGLPKGGETFFTVDRFSLPWAAPGGSGAEPADCLPVGTVPTRSREREGSISCAHSPCSFPCYSAPCCLVASGASPFHLRPRTGLSRNRRRAWSR